MKKVAVVILNYNGKNFLEKIKKGDSFLIPASLGEYTVKGKVAVLKSYPN